MRLLGLYTKKDLEQAKTRVKKELTKEHNKEKLKFMIDYEKNIEQLENIIVMDADKRIERLEKLQKRVKKKKVKKKLENRILDLELKRLAYI